MHLAGVAALDHEADLGAGLLADQVVVHRRRSPDSWLSQYYDQLKARLDWRAARIASARKLARAVHAMLRTGEVWREHA